jgi:hypothetical protein
MRTGKSDFMQRLAATLAALSLLACAGVTTATGAGGAPPLFPRLAGAWSHAEINVTIKKQQHTLILDRGKITQISPTQLTLHRRDGTTAVIQLSQQTLVVIDGVPAPSIDLRRKMSADTMKIDGGAAVRVRATSV